LTFSLNSGIFIDKATGFFKFGHEPTRCQPIEERYTQVKPLIEYFSASRAELAKVTWPSRRQTARLTLLVIIFSIVMAAILGALDFVFSTLVQKIIVKG
jgi:preprotein translocase subunit SecE